MLTRSKGGKSFRDAGTRIFEQEREAQHGIVSLLASKGPNSIKELPVGKVVPNPEQPRMTFHEETLQELAASIREHGVLQPILVRPAGDEYQIIAGERRWRASKLAGKLGKDKGYVENRLRLASAPDDVREMVAARYDTLSAAYELMKIEDKRRRKSLAKQVVAGKLTLIRLRDKVERVLNPGQAHPRPATGLPPLRDDSLITATRKLNEALQELARAVADEASSNIAEADRTNLAKFLTISRARMDNIVARLRSR